MSIQNRLKSFMANKDSWTLDEIYSGLPDCKPESIRGVLNGLVKADEDIKRLGRGVYGLVRETAQKGQ